MRRIKAQSSLEFVLLSIIIVAALLSAGAYFRRSVQGRMRANANDISAGAFYSSGITYGTTNIDKTIDEKSKSETTGNDFTINFFNRAISTSTSSVKPWQKITRFESIGTLAEEPEH